MRRPLSLVGRSRKCFRLAILPTLATALALALPVSADAQASTVDGAGLIYAPASTANQSTTFRINNQTANITRFFLHCSMTGFVSSCSTPTSVQLAGYASTIVTVTYATSAGQSGTLTELSGDATGTASAQDDIEVPVNHVTVSLSPSQITDDPGATATATATAYDASNNVLTGKSFTWQSSATSVATVNASGTVSGVGIGTATISATTGGVTGQASMSVVAGAPTQVAVSLSPTQITDDPGVTATASATAHDARGDVLSGLTFTWTSGSPTVASVNASGSVSGLTAGTSAITATVSGASGQATITVVHGAPASVSVSPSSASITAGGTESYGATVEDARGHVLSGATVGWSASPTSVATINGSGVATGVNAGTATITGSSGGKAGSASLTVTASITHGVTVMPTAGTVTENTSVSGSVTFTVKNTGSAQQTFTYATNCTGTAVSGCSVSPTSAVIAPNGGTATVTETFTTAASASATGSVGMKATESGWGESATGAYTVTLVSHGVSVTPDASPVSELTSQSSVSLSFTVQNTGSATENFSLSATCSGSAVTACTGPTSASIGAGASVSELVQFNTAGSAGLTGTVSLTASEVGATDADGGSYDVTLTSPITPSIGVSAHLLNPDSTIPRNLCLTMAAGEAGAYECGDLRLWHPLPAIRTFGTTRIPMLVYNSRAAGATGVIAANLIIANASAPAALEARVQIPGHADFVDTVTWNSACMGATCRVVVPISGDTLGTGPGAYHYTMEIKMIGGSGLTGTDSGVVILDDRRTSMFGKGWWLAGFEQLVSVDSTHLLWESGDGSARIYTKRSSTVWTAPSIAHPDTLLWDGAASVYRRLLPRKGYVEFDAFYRQTKTVNRLGRVTRFTYDAHNDLDSIVVPTPSGAPVRAYVFSYGLLGNGITYTLTSVTAPPIGAVARTTSLTRNTTTGEVTGITDPDGQAVAYRYRADTLSFANRLSDSTVYAFDAGGALSEARVYLSPSSYLATTFCASETTSKNNCAAGLVLATQASTFIDGPRSGASDTTRFWLNRYGAPLRVHDALGDTTAITYSTTWPGLVSRVVDPRGHDTRAAYDQRGNIDTVTDENPYADASDSRTAVTTYDWAGTDFLHQITLPEGEITTFTVDTLGNRTSQEDSRGAAAKVVFGYATSGTFAGMLDSVVEAPGLPPELVAYDSTLGNTARVTTPLGYATQYDADAVGRDTLVKGPLDGNGHTRNVRTVYDLMDRVDTVLTMGPQVTPNASWQAVFGTGFDTLFVANAYDAEGRLRSTTRYVSPNMNRIGHLETQWNYDAAGRKVAETAPDGHVEAWDYGDSVNVTRDSTRHGDVVRMSYDVLGRLLTRILPQTSWTDSLGTLNVPADTDRYGYDAAGHVDTASDHAATVIRSYHLNGTLAAETQRVATYAGVLGQHDYDVGYHYDRDARRDTLFYPGQSVKNLDEPPTPLAYHYTTYGALDRVSYAKLGGSTSDFAYYYNSRNLLDSLVYPNGVVAIHEYDDDDRTTSLWGRAPASNLGWRTATYPDGGGVASDSILWAGLTYNAAGQVIAAVGMDSVYTDLGYNGLGTLRWYAPFHQGMAHPGSEYAVDALGNIDTTSAINQVDPVVDLSDGTRYYDSTTARLDSIDAVPGSGEPQPLISRYGPGGSLTGAGRGRWAQVIDSKYGSAPTVSVSSVAEYAYDALGRLRMVKDRTVPANDTLFPADQWTDEETRYDALGRRVWVHTVHLDTTTTPCGGTPYCSTTRFVWDGNQLLGEFRMPDSLSEADTNTVYALVDTGTTINPPAPPDTTYSWYWGQVTYVPGPLDQPLAIFRSGGGKDSLNVGPFVMYPHTDWRGNVAAVSFATGGPTLNGNAAFTPPLPDSMNAEQTAYNMRTAGGREVLSWQGSLVEGQLGETGLVYRRNRYYDPVSGQFTQEDPMGLGGGLNLYGFAGGDPVSYQDPFGLCPFGGFICSLWTSYGNWRSEQQQKPRLLEGVVPSWAGAPDGPAAGGVAAVRAGQAGEDAVRAIEDIGPKTSIRVGARARIPDGLTGSVLTEVKNVKALSFTRQLRDFTQYAADNGLRFDLWVRQGAELSGPLKDAISSGLINLRTFVP